MIKYYKPTCTFQVLADNPKLGLPYQTVTLYKDEPFSVETKQKDLFDPCIEYWTNIQGWVLKITQSELDNLIHAKS